MSQLTSWLRPDQDFSLELLVSILQGALNTYTKGVKLGVNFPSNFTSGPYIIGAPPWTACSSCCGSWACTRAWPGTPQTLINVRKPSFSVFSVISEVWSLFVVW